MTTATGEVEAPEVGLHEDVPMRVYREWPGASKSRLWVLRNRSAAHLRYLMDHPTEPTTAQFEGTAIHTAVLEPETFHDRYAVIGRCEGVKNDGERCTRSGTVLAADGRSLCGQHARDVKPDDRKTVLSRALHEKCQAIYKRVRAHPYAKGLLGGAAERSAVWTDKRTGIRCKGRFDELAPEGVGALVDLKTTTDASPRAFERTIFRYGYHVQGAMYLDGAKALGEPVEWFVIIAVEKDPPYAVAVYRLREDAIEAGRDELKPLMDAYARCVETDEWPGYPMEVHDIALPPWAWKEVDARAGRI